MAVYKRSYRGYAGPVTSEWSRFAIIPRYAYRGLFRSKMMTAFFVICFIPPLVFLFLIYLANNMGSFARVFGVTGASATSPFAVNGDFFATFLGIQAGLSFILTAFVGPGLISGDLANRALPLYLSRPFSRVEYVIGKMSVLLILLSFITWVPGLVLFGMQGLLAGWGWLGQNLWLGWAVFAGSWIWILVLSLLALALSAWVKWRIAAGALLLAVFFVAAAFGDAINAVLEVHWGRLINLPYLFMTVWNRLFRARETFEISEASAWLMLGLICVGCLALLNRKLRAFEVVK
jgi:ABC-2 type transport system permease protein